jgi:hypothetical protein
MWYTELTPKLTEKIRLWGVALTLHKSQVKLHIFVKELLTGKKA